jgi:S1-C subfamily serine protease
MAQQATRRKRRSDIKILTLHHHHAKPYRKRHVGLLVVSVVALVLLAALAVDYQIRLISGTISSSNFVSDLFGGVTNYSAKVHSTFGYTLHYDQRSLYASAIDATTGDLYRAKDLSENRAYSVVRLSPTIIDSPSGQSSMTLTYHQDITYTAATTPAPESLTPTAFNDASITQSSFGKSSSNTVMIDGKMFVKATWRLNDTSGVASKIRSEVVTYTGIVNAHPVTIVINYVLGGGSGSSPYDAAISSLKFGQQDQASVPISSDVAVQMVKSRNLLDTFLIGDVASAATADNTVGTNSEKVAAKYGPAVVKVYNAYCMDIAYDGQVILKHACDAWTGSGFFLSQDGYIGTNGHVGATDPKDVLIEHAFMELAAGKSALFQGLSVAAGVTNADIKGLTTSQALTVFIDKMYAIDDSHITETNAIHNTLIGLNSGEPDLNAWIKATSAIQAYKGQGSIKNAIFIAKNYHAVDGDIYGLTGFKASDVAILKIDGSSYPVTKLGSIEDVSQGSNLLILGYPASATDNSIVDATASAVTLTTGQVSSIKNAAGSSSKLVETTTTIGHGNSGGPALDDAGNVIGIATYTNDVSSSGAGAGVFNYIRDIKDLQDLAAKNSISFDTNSKTQTEWNTALDFFYRAHYSQSLNNFANVKTLYPDNPRVQEFIDTANKRIAAGQDIKDFPIIPVAIVSAVFVIGVIVAVILIIRHKKHHNAFRAGVAQGTVQPTKLGDPSQTVVVSNPAVGPIVTSIPTTILTPSVTSVVSTPEQERVPLPTPPPVPEPTVSVSSDEPAISTPPIDSNPTKTSEQDKPTEAEDPTKRWFS